MISGDTIYGSCSLQKTCNSLIAIAACGFVSVLINWNILGIQVSGWNYLLCRNNRVVYENTGCSV